MLERLGYARPAEDDVVIQLTYASQLRMPPESLHECAGIVAPVPGRPTGMAILRYEHDTVMFAVFGMAGNDPPLGCSAMCAFAEHFAPAHLLAAIRAAEPLERQRSIGSRRAVGAGTTKRGSCPGACWSSETRRAASTRSMGRV